MFAIAFLKIGRNVNKKKGKHREVVDERRKGLEVFLKWKKELRENYKVTDRTVELNTWGKIEICKGIEEKKRKRATRIHRKSWVPETGGLEAEGAKTQRINGAVILERFEGYNFKSWQKRFLLIANKTR